MEIFLKSDLMLWSALNDQNTFEPRTKIQFFSSEKFKQCHQCLSPSLSLSLPVIWGSSNAEFPLAFNVTSDLPVLKGTSLLFPAHSCGDIIFLCDHSLSVWLRSTGLNDCDTMLHCLRTCDVGAQENHGGLSLYISNVALQQCRSLKGFFHPRTFVTSHRCPARHGAAYENAGRSLPGLFSIAD